MKTFLNAVKKDIEDDLKQNRAVCPAILVFAHLNDEGEIAEDSFVYTWNLTEVPFDVAETESRRICQEKGGLAWFYVSMVRDSTGPAVSILAEDREDTQYWVARVKSKRSLGRGRSVKGSKQVTWEERTEWKKKVQLEQFESMFAPLQ